MNTRDKWVESARLYIHDESEVCDCDCWLCTNNEHDEHCEEEILEEDEIIKSS
jgi:hypothetical protein